MSQIANLVMGCLTGRNKSASVPTAEKPSSAAYKDSKVRMTQEVANDVLTALYGAEKAGPGLEQTLQDIVSECGWTESLAAAILNGLEAALKEGAPMGQAMKDACEKAVEAIEKVLGLVKDFEREHPRLFWGLVAVGVLVALAPWALVALGFGELGPIEGSFATWWQARYAGFVPKNAWFSFFQRLGMTWKRAVGGKGYSGRVPVGTVLWKEGCNLRGM